MIFGRDTLTNAGQGRNMFIVKNNTSGNIIWAKSAGGIDIDHGSGITTDASGNIYVTGSFSSPTITFGTTTLTDHFNANGNYGCFCCKI